MEKPQRRKGNTDKRKIYRERKEMSNINIPCKWNITLGKSFFKININKILLKASKMSDGIGD